MARSSKAVKARVCSALSTTRGCVHKTSTQTVVIFSKARLRLSRSRYRLLVSGVWASSCFKFVRTLPPQKFCQLQALSHLLDRRQHGAIHNPSAFLTIALNNASFDPSPVNIAHSATGKAEFSSAFCTSANHLLSILAKEGLTAADIDPDCQAYLARARPAVQTQVCPCSLLVPFCLLPKHILKPGDLLCFCRPSRTSWKHGVLAGSKMLLLI